MILRGSVYSRVLEMETGIAVIASSDFDHRAPRRVYYLLHGLCGNSTNYLDYTLLPLYAKKHRAVFVMPEVGRRFRDAMRNTGFDFTYEELPGEHDWFFFDQALRRALEWCTTP